MSAKEVFFFPSPFGMVVATIFLIVEIHVRKGFVDDVDGQLLRLSGRFGTFFNFFFCLRGSDSARELMRVQTKSKRE